MPQIRIPIPKAPLLALAAYSVFTYQPTGGVSLSGTAGVVRTFAPATSGGITLAGSAGKARTVVPAVSGGVVLSGTAPNSRTITYGVSGGATLAGSSPVAITRAPAVLGGVTLAGAAPLTRTWARDGSGGVILSGTADHARTIVVGAAGGIDLSGAASTLFIPSAPEPQPPAGGGGGGGYSVYYQPRREAPREAPKPVVYAFRGRGGFDLGGSANATRISVYSVLGTVRAPQLRPAAVVERRVVRYYAGSGLIFFSGSAGALLIPFPYFGSDEEEADLLMLIRS